MSDASRSKYLYFGMPTFGVVLLFFGIIFSLQFFMERLLLRDAAASGMRWAEIIEHKISDLDLAFKGQIQNMLATADLELMSSIGRIYRYEFMDPHGRIFYALGIADQNAEEAGHIDHPHTKGIVHLRTYSQHRAGDLESHSEKDHDRDHPARSPAEGTDHAHAAPIKDINHGDRDWSEHGINLRRGNGVDQPDYYALIEHPIIRGGQHLGTINVFLDQTEKYGLYRETILWLLAILTGICALGFGVPSVYYLRGRAAAEKANKSARFYAHHDAMTRLINRKKFTDSVDSLLEAQAESGAQHALHFIDVDKFKSTNDAFGHEAGDELLRQIADRLRSATPSGSILARIGGDEFAALQTNIRSDDEIDEFAAQLVSVLSGLFRISGHDVPTTASIGTAVSPNDGTSCKALMKHADIALYTVKANGRNGYRRYVPHMKAERDMRIKLENTIRNAYAGELFELHFQPLFKSKTSQLSGFEALVRMRGDDGKHIPPNQFIPVAEEIGLMPEIGRWVLMQATKFAAEWPDHLNLAVNLSTKQFEDGSLVRIVRDALDMSGLLPGRLELEITESLIMANTEWNIAQLRSLKDLGVSIVMDDFGTGYSSLGYLWRFPFDKIKIDQSFLRGLSGDPDKVTEIIRTIIALGHSLNMAVTAEGVETADQLSMLCDLECDLIQGFYLGRPHPIEQVSSFLLNEFQKHADTPEVASVQKSA